MSKILDGKRVINGTYGEVWMNGDPLAEAKAIKATVKLSKEKISRCGTIIPAQKVTGIENTGSLRLYKVDSRQAKLAADNIRQGKDTQCTIIVKLADPDSEGVERVSLSGVTFDELSLVDFEVGKLGEVEIPFTFEDFQYLDMI